jgi:hypothetical protein
VEIRTPLRRGKPLTLIPFVFHGPRHSLPDVDKLPLADIIAVNLDHYRLNADYKHGLHFTALPTAWVSGFDKEANLRIGASAAWVTETVGASAGFLEFTGQGLTTFERAMDRDERLMALLGSRMLEEQKRMGAIVDLVAGYWARTDEGLLVPALKGIFAAASMAGNKLAIASESVAGQSAATRLNGATFVDATAKLGDRADRLAAVAMHSATEAALRKLDLIDFIPDSEGKAQIRTFQGRRVVVDDNLPTRAGSTDGTVYTTYLFGPGAFGKGAAPLDGTPLQGGFGTEGVELARVPLDSDTVLINRRRYILHPRGVKFTSASVAGDSPTNAELETAANWARVWENKNVRIVAVTHNN